MFNILSSPLSPPVQAIKSAFSLDRVSSSAASTGVNSGRASIARRVLDFSNNTSSTENLWTEFQVYRISSHPRQTLSPGSAHGQVFNEDASLVCVIKSIQLDDEEEGKGKNTSVFAQSQALVGSIYEQLGNALPTFISSKKG